MNEINNDSKKNSLKLTINDKLVTLTFALEPNFEVVKFIKKNFNKFLFNKKGLNIFLGYTFFRNTVLFKDPTTFGFWHFPDLTID